MLYKMYTKYFASVIFSESRLVFQAIQKCKKKSIKMYFTNISQVFQLSLPLHVCESMRLHVYLTYI